MCPSLWLIFWRKLWDCRFQFGAMSIPSVEGDGQAKGLGISGISSEWEKCQAIRQHLRGEGNVIFEEGTSESVKAACKPWIHGYLMPLLIRMAEVDGKPQPFVDPLRDEISSFYKLFSKQVEDPQVVFDSWMTRKFLGMVKAKARKEQPSTDPFLRLYSIHYVVVFVLLALYIYIMYSLFI